MPSVASAATLTWSATGTSSAIGGTGNWDTSALQWTANGSTWSAWSNTTNANDVAWFGGTAGTVTLSTGITAGGVTFGTSGYTVTGNTITLGASSTTMTVDVPLATDSATISALFNSAGGGNFTKSGSGLVTLSGANNRISSGFSGVWTVTGTLGAATGSINTVYGSGITLNNGSLSSLGVGDSTIGSFWFSSGKTITATGTANFVTGTNVVAINAGNTLTFATPTTSDAVTVSGNIIYQGNVAKTGSGSVVFTGNNTYSGSTTISSGTLQVGGGGTTGVLGSGNVGNDGTLTFNRSDSVTVANVISGAGKVVMAGSGTLTLSGTNSYSGGTVVNAGTLVASSSGVDAGAGLSPALGTGTVTVNNALITANQVRSVGGGSNTTRALVLNTGTWNVDYAGGGGDYMATLDMTNGLVTTSSASWIRVPNGGLAVTSRAASGTSVIDARIDLTYNDISFNVADGTATYDLLMTGAISQNTFAGSGDKNLTKSGAGTLALQAAGSYSGNTTVAAGVLTLGSGGSLASTTAVSIASGATLNLFGAANQLQGGFPRDTANSASLAIGGTLGVGSNAQTVYATTLSMTNGAIAFTDPDGYLWMPNRTITFNGGSNTISGNSSLGIYLGISSGTLALSTPLATDAVTISAVLSGAGSGNLTKTGSGLIALSGGNNRIGSAFSGVWTVTGTLGAATGSINTVYASGITLNNGSLSSLGVGDATIGSFWFSSGKTITATGTANFVTGTNVVAIGSGQTLTFSTPTTSDAVTVSGNILYLGKVAKTGDGRLTLSASNSYSGGTTLNAGVLSFGTNALGSGNVTLNSGTLQWASGNAQDISSKLVLVSGSTATLDTNGNNVTLGSGFGGNTSAALVKAGGGTLTLSASNSYSGGTTLNQGTLSFVNGGLGSSGNVTLAASTVLRWAGGNTQDISSRLVLPGSGGVTLDVTNGNATLASGLGAASAVALTKAGAGTLTLSGSSGYTGNTTISTGTLALSGAGSIASSSQVSIASGAALDISAATAAMVEIGALSGSGSVALGSRSLRSVGATSGTFDGVIGGAGGFTKAGVGTLTLTRKQDFLGAARIEAGTLAFGLPGAGGDKLLQSANAIYVASGASLDVGTSGLTVVGGQTLGGYGTVSGNVAFEANSILSPGGSVGALTTTGTVAFTGPMTYVFDVNDAGGAAGGPNGWDLSTANTFTFTGFDTTTNRFVVDLTSLSGTTPNQDAANFNPSNNYAWKFLVASDLNPISVTNGWFQVDTTNFTNSPHPGNFYVARGDQLGAIGGSGDTNALYVVYAAVPEPGTLTLAGIGAAVAVLFRRRRGTRAVG